MFRPGLTVLVVAVGFWEAVFGAHCCHVFLFFWVRAFSDMSPISTVLIITVLILDRLAVRRVPLKRLTRNRAHCLHILHLSLTVAQISPVITLLVIAVLVLPSLAVLLVVERLRVTVLWA